MDVILYNQENGIVAIVYPCNTELSINLIAELSVPNGVPYIIADSSVIPTDRGDRDQWTLSASELENPDGYGKK